MSGSARRRNDVRRLRGHPAASERESLRTSLVAVATNVGVVAVKAAAALATGSAVMAAETLHSVADVLNEVLLLVGVVWSSRPPDRRHPSGHGRDRWFWSLLAAVGVFVGGGVASVVEGVRTWASPAPLEVPGLALGVLALCAGFEASSWWVARRQMRAEARDHRIDAHRLVDLTTDPAPVTVYLEDSAALVGIGLAAAAVVARMATGVAQLDPAGSVLVGLLLMWVAWRLVAYNRQLLLGTSAPEATEAHVRALVGEEHWVVAVSDLEVVHTGPGRLAVEVDVVPDVSLSASDLVREVGELRDRLIAFEGVDSAAVTLVEKRGPQV